MNSIAILGSGFGLYGYLPALVSGCGKDIVLPERYRKRFSERSELQPFADRVTWTPDEQAALKSATGAVLALCPTIQCHWLDYCLEQPHLQTLFLEKPLAPTPQRARQIQDRLESSGKVIRIAYLFRHLKWAQDLRRFLEQVTSKKLRIRWQFMAHHFRHDLPSWKREIDQGGGPLRFYGIHLVALLAELGFDAVVQSCSSTGMFGHPERWQATFTGPGMPICEVDLDTASTDTQFTIHTQSTRMESCWFEDVSPFSIRLSGSETGTLDGRVETLSVLCRSAWQNPCRVPEFYRPAIDLWNEIENRESNPLARLVA
jgi:hypothetical protein